MNIVEIIEKIRNAVFGVEVRDSIANGIESIYNVTSETQKKQQSLENSFDNLIINAGNSNAEIVDARGAHETLRHRLDESDDKLNAEISNVRQEVEQSSSNTSENVAGEINKIKTMLNEAFNSMSNGTILWESSTGIGVTGSVLELSDDISKYYDIICVCDFNGYDYNNIVSNSPTLSLRGVNIADTPSLSSKSTEFYEIGLKKVNDRTLEITRNNRIVVSSSGARTKENDSEYSKIRRIYGKKKITIN